MISSVHLTANIKWQREFYEPAASWKSGGGCALQLSHTHSYNLRIIYGLALCGEGGLPLHINTGTICGWTLILSNRFTEKNVHVAILLKSTKYLIQ